MVVMNLTSPLSDNNNIVNEATSPANKSLGSPSHCQQAVQPKENGATKEDMESVDLESGNASLKSSPSKQSKEELETSYSGDDEREEDRSIYVYLEDRDDCESKASSLSSYSQHHRQPHDLGRVVPPLHIEGLLGGLEDDDEIVFYTSQGSTSNTDSYPSPAKVSTGTRMLHQPRRSAEVDPLGGVPQGRQPFFVNDPHSQVVKAVNEADMVEMTAAPPSSRGNLTLAAVGIVAMVLGAVGIWLLLAK